MGALLEGETSMIYSISFNGLILGAQFRPIRFLDRTIRQNGEDPDLLVNPHVDRTTLAHFPAAVYMRKCFSRLVARTSAPSREN